MRPQHCIKKFLSPLVKTVTLKKTNLESYNTSMINAAHYPHDFTHVFPHKDT